MTTEEDFNAVWDAENDSDGPWRKPTPDGIRHAMTVDGEGLLTCCGRSPHVLPAGDLMTAAPERVTCKGMA